MRTFARPRVFASRCLGFASCRWNGLCIPDACVDRLKPYVDFVTECPEMAIGLGVPRQPVRVVRKDGAELLIQPATGRDCTAEMASFASRYLDTLGRVDGFILKSKSPSCGLKDVKIYSGLESAAALGRSAGLFGRSVRDSFKGLAIEDEARLGDVSIWEHFLCKIFTSADLGVVEKKNVMKGLVDFHARNKYLVMSASPKALSGLGRIVANQDGLTPARAIAMYAETFRLSMAQPPRYKTRINALMHTLGYVSKGLSQKERARFLEELERYRKGRIPFSVPLAIMASFVVRFEEKYLLQQTLFEPYPEDLMLVTDSGKGRTR